ncbi:methyltransferase [Mycobacterium intracellulare]|uniref:methyltransferase n=1 Tax=Mycobacterium intracellulare TaxID=1767 RepID=UPI003FEE2C34
MTALPVPSGAQDYERMMTMLTGFWVTQIVRAAATFNVADHLAAGTDTAEAIAAEESIDPEATRRLIRACASLGLVSSADGVRLSGTSLLSTLLRDDPNSLRGMALAQAAPGHWLTWGCFPDAVRSGASQMEAAHGTPGTIFDYLAAHPDEASHFTEAMSNLSAATAIEIAKLVNTRGVKYAVDVGGANGEVLRAMMRANPDLRGGVFDLPRVVPDAAAAARKDGLQERLSAVGGDFFESVPPSDLYVLKYILHDWDDQKCIRILKNCRAALQAGGRLVVIDYLVGEFGVPGMPTMMDMNMLVMTGGKERDIAEFDALFAAAGLRRATVGRAGQFAVIETVGKP